MADKLISAVYSEPLEIEILQKSTDYLIDDTDGIFRAVSVDDRIQLVANATIAQLQEYTENRVAFPDGDYVILFYTIGGTVPLDSYDMEIKDDVEIISTNTSTVRLIL